jgi:hypothetical protein
MLCNETYYKPIKIRIRDTDINSYNIPVEMIDRVEDNDYLVIYIDSDNYSSKVQYDDLEMYSFGTLPNLASEIYSISMQIDYTEINILEAINSICRNDLINGRRTEILDYVRPNNYTDTYTTRLGTFNFLDITYEGQISNYRPKGLSLVFLELPSVYRSLIIGGVEYFVKETDYKQVKDGEFSKLSVAGKGSYLIKSVSRTGFTAKLDYADVNVYRTILNITRNSLATSTPITITDNLSPEGYTTRTGYIQPNIEVPTGIKYYPNTTTPYLPQGFNITFLDTTLRYV